MKSDSYTRSVIELPINGGIIKRRMIKKSYQREDFGERKVIGMGFITEITELLTNAELIDNIIQSCLSTLQEIVGDISFQSLLNLISSTMADHIEEIAVRNQINPYGSDLLKECSSIQATRIICTSTKAYKVKADFNSIRERLEKVGPKTLPEKVKLKIAKEGLDAVLELPDFIITWTFTGR